MARRARALALGVAGASAVVSLGFGAFAGPASAAPAAGAVLTADSTPTATDGPTKRAAGRLTLVQRRDRACDRIPEALTRSQKLAERLAGDASTRGSIAHLTAIADKAEAEGNAERAAKVRARLKVRQDVQELLPERVERLKAAQTGICVDVAVAAADQEPWQSVAPRKPGAGKGTLIERLDRSCGRIPELLTRSQRLEARLAGSETTRGSVAYLEALATKLDAEGDAERATKVRNRLKVRQDVQELLPGRVERLKAAQTGICVDVEAAVTAAGK